MSKNNIQQDIPLIRTKLAPPRIGGSSLRRDSLMQSLKRLQHCKLGIVLGPAGSGKTVLLAQWRQKLAEGGAKVAWYNLGPDDDISEFGAYLIESLKSAGLTVSTDELLFFVRSGGESRNRLLSTLVDDMIDAQEEIYLFIDDLHFCSSNAIVSFLDALIVAIPDNVHIVIGSRSRPTLSLSRIHTQHQLFELDFSELRFSIEETRKFVAAQGLSQLTSMQVKRLHDMSDGWAAGLQLLIFSLRKESQAEHFFERHADSPSLSQEDALFSYLESNVADYISTEELDILMAVSVCRRFNRKLAEALLDNNRVGEILRKFEQEQLFLLPIETPDPEPWYRFHKLFASFLQSRLEKGGMPRIKELRQRAARWFAEQRFDIEALRYASEAADNDLVAELIDRSARRLSAGGEFRQIIKYCNQLPDNSLRDRLNISLNLAWAQISCGNFEDFQKNLKRIIDHPKRFGASVKLEVQLLRAYSCSALDDTQGVVDIIEPLLEESPPQDGFLLSLLSTLAASGFTYAGRYSEARETARIFYEISPRIRGHQENFLSNVVMGCSYLMQGRIRDAIAHLKPFIDSVVLPGKLGPDAVGNSMGLLCQALYQNNQLDQARELYDTYAEIIAAAELPDGVMAAYRMRARLALTAGHPQSAFESLKELEEIAIRRGLDRLLAWSLYDQFVLAAQHHHLSSHEELLERLQKLSEKYSDKSACAWAEIPLAAALAAAENAIYQNLKPTQCLPLLSHAGELAQSLGRGLITMRIGFLRCIVRLQIGEQKQAIGEATALLEQVAESGALRTVADIGDRAQPLVRLLMSRIRSDSAKEILNLALATESPTYVATHSHELSVLIDPLTQREQEVLEQLGRGLSAKSIGRDLGISPTTAKWHLKNAYSKLGAISREDALNKARQFRIIN